MLTPDRIRDAAAWAYAEKCRRALQKVASVLAPAGISILAFKGIHLAHEVAPEPWNRPLGDADAVVLNSSFRGAVALVRARSEMSVLSSGAGSCILNYEGGRVDLQRRILPDFFGRLDSAVVMDRATRATQLGQNVLVPDPADAACIAIAHFVKDLCGRVAAPRLVGDLDLLQRRCGLTPQSLWDRLKLRELRLAGAVALSETSQDALLGAGRLSEQERNRCDLVRQLIRFGSRWSLLSRLVLPPLTGDDQVRAVLGSFWGIGRFARLTLRRSDPR